MTTPPPAPATPPGRPAAPRPAARAESVTKTFGRGAGAVTALDSVSVAIADGALTAVMGPSGSGKSTLMHVMGGLDSPTAGRTFLGEEDLTALDDDALSALRRRSVGFVFQAFNLMPTMDAADNIRLPIELDGRRTTAEEEGRVADLLTRLGLRDRWSHRPGELSGGQQQRVAIARALVTRPRVIFADEPTGNLDRRSGAAVMDLLVAATREEGQAIMLVTHDPSVAARADRVVFLADGRVAHEMTGPASRTQISAVMDELEGDLA